MSDVATEMPLHLSYRRCTRCVLPEVYPGIRFNEEGVCNVCEAYRTPVAYGEKALMDRIEGKTGRAWDCVCSVGGARGSVHLLRTAVKRLGLRTLALSFDNPFRTEQAYKHIVDACDRLDISLRSICAPKGVTRRVVRDALLFFIPRGPKEVKKHICSACLAGAYGSVYGTAIEEGIPQHLRDTMRHYRDEFLIAMH